MILLPDHHQVMSHTILKSNQLHLILVEFWNLYQEQKMIDWRNWSDLTLQEGYIAIAKDLFNILAEAIQVRVGKWTAKNWELRLRKNAISQLTQFDFLEGRNSENYFRI